MHHARVVHLDVAGSQHHVDRQALVDLARAGSAVLMISQDLDEIFEISDRVAVLSDGRLSQLYPAGSLTGDQIGMLMGGIHHDHDGIAERAHHAA